VSKKIQAQNICQIGLEMIVQKKDYLSALAQFSLAISLDPTVPGYYANKASCLSQLGKIEESIKFNNKAIELDSTSRESRHWIYNQGGNYLNLKDYKKAIEYYSLALSRYPQDDGIKKQLFETKRYVQHYLKLVGNKKEKNKNKEIKVFISYSHQDEVLKDKLENHLSSLKRMGFIKTWNDRKIMASDEWGSQIDSNLADADIIICLISSDFIKSDYCYSQELDLALKRHKEGNAKLIPIILRPVVWSILPFGKIQALPKDGKAVTTWENEDSAFENITYGILDLVHKLRAV
jgi:tetratricopeptide (TPR) repeat protein